MKISVLAKAAFAASLFQEAAGLATEPPPLTDSSSASSSSSCVGLTFNEPPQKQTVDEQCSKLNSILPGKVYYPSTPSYNASMEGFWTLQATFETPNCIVHPALTPDVATAVKTLVAGSCKFSIKGGGHTPFAGAASINNGVTIDMTGMNTVTVNSQRTVASIGAGSRWLHVYQALEPQGMMVAGGRDSDVGVGGLVLGGGYSWFTSARGFVADGLVNVELVTAAGKVINVNATSNSDLFVGLKGGGNNFGVVTRYDLAAFSFGTMWGGSKVYSNDTTDAQIAAFVDFVDNAATDSHANLINYYQYTANTGANIVFNVMDYTLPVANPPIYNKVNAIPGIIADTTRIANLSSYTEELSSAAQRNRNIFLTLTFSNDATMYGNAVDISNSRLKPFLHTPNLTWSLLFQPIPAIISNASRANGGNIMGVDRNSGNLILYLLYITWSDPTYDNALQSAADATIKEIRAKSIETRTDNPYIYLNYAGKDQDVLGGYGKVNVRKMEKLSAKYDPHSVFQSLVPGGWKIGKANPTTP